jgi:Transcriptional regulator
MTPRPYRQGRRQLAAQKTRAKVLRAARSLLTGRGTERFSLDAVAERAGVARMTVYYQFRSRRGLIEALFDSFAEGGELPEQVGVAFQQSDPDQVLAGVVSAFAHFWQAGRTWVRRVRALGVLDAELGAAIEARNARRRQVMRICDGTHDTATGPSVRHRTGRGGGDPVCADQFRNVRRAGRPEAKPRGYRPDRAASGPGGA